MTDLLVYIHSLLFDPTRIPLAMGAIMTVGIFGVATGPMRGNANPLYWAVVNGLFGGFGARLDRVQRTPADLMMRGFFVTVLGLGFFYLCARLAASAAFFYPAAGLTEVVLLSLCLSAGTIWYALLKLFFALKDKKVGKGAYYTIASSSRCDLSASDDFTITRVGMALAARNFDKGLVAPVVWYLIAGLPGAFVYTGLAALAWRFGKDGFTKGFGRLPLALERLMGFVPTLLAGFLLAAAGLLTPTGGMTRAFIGVFGTGKGRAPYDQGGQPVTAMAWSLGVSLGGPNQDLDGSALQRAWVGPEGATARLEASHLRRAIYLHLMAVLLLLAALGGGLFWGHIGG